MSKFFIRRPIVAMVIAILMVIVGAVAIVSLPIASFRTSPRLKSGCRPITRAQTPKPSKIQSQCPSNSKLTAWTT